MSTLDNLNKIVQDLNEKEKNKNTYYSNVSNRLDKVLNNYLRELDINYNKILNSNDLSRVAKELIR